MVAFHGVLEPGRRLPGGVVSSRGSQLLLRAEFSHWSMKYRKKVSFSIKIKNPLLQIITLHFPVLRAPLFYEKARVS